MPLVSLIVPVYGVDQYIERCAVSLLGQTYGNIEYIFVNDATKDNSIGILKQVIEHFPNRKGQITILEHKQNRGLSAARNTGISASTGDYIWHIDSDDYIAHNAVELLVKEATYKDADIVVFDTYKITQKGILSEHVAYKDKTTYIKQLLQHTQKCAHWNKFYKASLYRESGIRSDEQIRLAEDYAVTPRLVYMASKIAVLHEPLYYYETTNQSSYVHNLTLEAIESQYSADRILVDFFSDKQDYADVVAVLPQRSMTSLIKNSDIEDWRNIVEVYHDHIDKPQRGMSLVNRIIYHLASHGFYCRLQVLMSMYHFVMPK